MKILFLCVANSARSQMAEGLAKSLFAAEVEVQSAGSRPSGVNPLAVRALDEIGISLAGHSSKSTDQLSPEFLAAADYVVTLCAEEVCPVVVAPARRLHWPLPDPAGTAGTELEQLERFRRTREALAQRLLAFARERGIPMR